MVSKINHKGLVLIKVNNGAMGSRYHRSHFISQIFTLDIAEMNNEWFEAMREMYLR